MGRNKHTRLTSAEKDQIKWMTLEGKSLRDLVKITGLGITTIYYQVRKFKPKQQKEFVVNINDKEIGELIGAFAGDGTYYHKIYDPLVRERCCPHKIRYCLSSLTDLSYADYLIGLLRKLNLNPYIIKKKDGNAIEATINSKPYMEFIQKFLIWEKDKTYTIRLRNILSSYSDDFLQGFARGLMDTDGFLNEANAACGCISKELMNNLSDIFTKFDIIFSRTSRKPYKNNRELFFVRVLRKGLNKYKEKIGFSNPYKMKHLERITNNGVAGI